MTRDNPPGDEKPWILDAYCKAGGSTKGWQLAGFRVAGVDIEPQPNYCGDEFIQGDALEYLADQDLSRYVAVHSGPSCQGYSVTASLHDVVYPRHIGVVRVLLAATGLPFVIENVEGARRAMRDPIRLCGSSFGLGVRRHRLFETSWPIMFPPECAHYAQPEPVDVTGTGAARIGDRLDGGGGNSRKPRNLAHARDVMGIDWMSRRELSEAIPPAYTEWLGRSLASHLQLEAA